MPPLLSGVLVLMVYSINNIIDNSIPARQQNYYADIMVYPFVKHSVCGGGVLFRNHHGNMGTVSGVANTTNCVFMYARQVSIKRLDTNCGRYMSVTDTLDDCVKKSWMILSNILYGARVQLYHRQCDIRTNSDFENQRKSLTQQQRCIILTTTIITTYYQYFCWCYCFIFHPFGYLLLALYYYELLFSFAIRQ